MGFSVLLSVYYKDNPLDFLKAIRSISLEQTLSPAEIILVVDGPVPDDLNTTIIALEQEISYLTVIRLQENVGLGKALNIGMNHVSNELVARMDADDISLPDRFEKQLAYMEKNIDCDLVGGQISEFIGNPNNIVGKRLVPSDNTNIVKWIKKRCPFNHMTVMFKKSKVLEVGNYIDWHYNEDYYLWIRMAKAGCKFSNLSDILVNVRVGKDMYARRGGWRYFKSEKGIQDYMLKNGIISLPLYCFNTIIRFLVQVLMPNKIRAFVFRNLFRKK